MGRFRPPLPVPRIQKAQRANSVELQYESSDGSVLPVLSTLRDLVQTGGNVRLLWRCLSGTMAYVFYHMGEGLPFSEAVCHAIDQDFAELDVREDLSGLNVCRKVVILAQAQDGRFRQGRGGGVANPGQDM